MKKNRSTRLTKDDAANAMADFMTHCYASTKGCKRMPVRVIYEVSPNESGVVDMVVLCPDHAATYRPEGRVISDAMLAEGDNLKLLNEMHW